jgi:hypothetical protein
LPEIRGRRRDAVAFGDFLPGMTTTSQKFNIGAKANILSLLLFSTAGLISKEIAVSSCDNRPLDEK